MQLLPQNISQGLYFYTLLGFDRISEKFLEIKENDHFRFWLRLPFGYDLDGVVDKALTLQVQDSSSNPGCVRILKNKSRFVSRCIARVDIRVEGKTNESKTGPPTLIRNVGPGQWFLSFHSKARNRVWNYFYFMISASDSYQNFPNL